MVNCLGSRTADTLALSTMTSFIILPFEKGALNLTSYSFYQYAFFSTFYLHPPKSSGDGALLELPLQLEIPGIWTLQLYLSQGICCKHASLSGILTHEVQEALKNASFVVLECGWQCGGGLLGVLPVSSCSAFCECCPTCALYSGSCPFKSSFSVQIFCTATAFSCYPYLFVTLWFP